MSTQNLLSHCQTQSSEQNAHTLQLRILHFTAMDDLPCPWIQTPLVESAALSKIAGWYDHALARFIQDTLLTAAASSLSLKTFSQADLSSRGEQAFSVVVAFKVEWLMIRGIGNEILAHLRSNPKSTSTPHFYTSSGGNAGLACVAACKTLGYPSTIVVPHSTKPHMIEKLRLAGASEVIQHGATWFDADTHLREDLIPKDPGGVYLHPFDHPAVRDGNATLVTECHEQMGEEDMDAIVCSVGGGGLFSGIAQGLKGRSTKILTVETKGAESLYESVQAGKLITLDGITSIATSLGAKTVALTAFEYAMKDNVESVVVSDEEACRACVRFAEDERMLVEPACGATLALVYEDKLAALVPNFGKQSTVVLVVCGGRAIGLDLLQEWKMAYT